MALAVCHGTQVSSSAVTDDEPTLERLAGLYVFRYPIVVDEDHRAATTELTDDVDPAYTRCPGVWGGLELQNHCAPGRW